MASAASIAAEYCSIVHLHLHNRIAAFAEEIASYLGLPERDNRWVTPSGRAVNFFVDRSVHGGFSSTRWSIAGWELDEMSMVALVNEFPDDFR